MLIWPVQNNQNNSEVVNAATEVIGGITYETIYLTGNSDANVAELTKRANTNGNYRYILTANWSLLGQNQDDVSFYGNAIIVDLNGYAVNCQSGVGLYFCCPLAEVVDSSLTRGGQITNSAVIIGVRNVKRCQLTLSGGFIRPDYYGFNQYCDLDLIINGGTGAHFNVPSGSGYLGLTRNWGNYDTTLTFAPWVELTYQNDGRISGWNSRALYYVVSPRKDILSGVYNYEYSLASDLTGGELSKLDVPADKTYYLWGRGRGDAYEYLNIYYDPGKKEWVTA